MSYVIIVERISCDKCGYYDDEDKFPTGCEEGVDTLCPICGNMFSFDFDPDDKIPQGCPKLEFVP